MPPSEEVDLSWTGEVVSKFPVPRPVSVRVSLQVVPDAPMSRSEVGRPPSRPTGSQDVCLS